MTSRQSHSTVFLNREMSWLEFNSRVLDEARDPKNPLLERLRFFCIFHSNLDEFFMVRVASLWGRLREGDTSPDPAGLTPYRQLELIGERVAELSRASYTLYNKELIPALAKEKIRLLQPGALAAAQQRYLDEYFDREVYPVLTPLAIEESKPFPHLLNFALNLAVLLRGSSEPEDAPARLAVVQVPGRLPGLCRLPDATCLEVTWLDEVIRMRLQRLFAGFQILEAAGFRLTRGAELELDEDDAGADYVHSVESKVRARRTGKPLRVEIEASTSPQLRALLLERLGVDEAAVLEVQGPLDTRPLLFLVDMPGYDHLRYTPQLPIVPAVFQGERDIFDVIRDGDILLQHPYDSFDPVVEFVQSAADDPDVLAIKQTLYRTGGGGSPILNALIKAAENGKQVTALIELTARFDEEHNIGWARNLEEAGAHVLYGLVGLKAHAKVTLVVRREPGGIRRYVHLGTGNYNERTARIYCDFGLFTAAPEFGSDASGFFNAITGYSEPPEFQRLTMAPVGLRQKIISFIRREADRARADQKSGILAKMNSLVDPQVILELCVASTAGVPIRLMVRGICCLRPGVPNHSEKIKVVSIVDRYLEHGRAWVFFNGGENEVYLSSADWMPRNLDRRVELAFPVMDEAAKRRLVETLEVQFADNQKARVLGADGSYSRVSAGRAEPLRAQEYLYRLLLEERERALSAAPARFVPLEGSRP
jgi:polyphosphate kinase